MLYQDWERDFRACKKRNVHAIKNVIKKDFCACKKKRPQSLAEFPLIGASFTFAYPSCNYKRRGELFFRGWMFSDVFFYDFFLFKLSQLTFNVFSHFFFTFFFFIFFFYKLSLLTFKVFSRFVFCLINFYVINFLI